MPHPDLIAHGAQFRKEVIELAPGVFSAVGFAASNAHMIEGADSVTIIDTTESVAAAENILAEFRKRTAKPVARIIYTHSHRDHISGASVFSDGSQPILASSRFESDLVAVDATRAAPNAALGRRTQAQFGIGLRPDERISLGCGPGDRPMRGLGEGFLPPTERIAGDRDIDLGGIAARLIHAPGETADHMVVWLPERRILFSGDNWYHAFPNLYAIRGTPYRDFDTWAASLDQLAALAPQVLAPGHTRPVFGASRIQEVLSTTAAAIRYVIAHAVAGMNAGQDLDEIVATALLPDALAALPWLGQFYGRVDWAVRAYAVGTLGWYDGNPTHLGTLSPQSRAEQMARLAGGIPALAAAAETSTDPQWKLELCDHLLALGHPAAALKAATLRDLAEHEINATARNTYLWQAKALDG